MNIPEDKLTDLEPLQSRKLMSSIWKRIIISICSITTLIATVIVTNAFLKHDNDDSTPEMLGTVIGAALTYFVLIPAIAVLIASPISLIPIKRFAYKEKLWAISLVIILLLQPIVMLAAISIYMKTEQDGQERTEILSK